MTIMRIAAVLAAGTVCAAQAGPDAAGALTHFEKLTLERTACEGTCPVYLVVIHGDGKVDFKGYNSVNVRSATATLSPGQMQALVAAINKARYFSLRDLYRTHSDGCPVWWTDNPSVFTSVTSRGVTKKIHHDLGCRERDERDVNRRPGRPYPPELTAFETAIDEIVNTARWLKRSPVSRL